MKSWNDISLSWGLLAPGELNIGVQLYIPPGYCLFACSRESVAGTTAPLVAVVLASGVFCASCVRTAVSF